MITLTKPISGHSVSINPALVESFESNVGGAGTTIWFADRPTPLMVKESQTDVLVLLLDALVRPYNVGLSALTAELDKVYYVLLIGMLASVFSFLGLLVLVVFNR